MQDKSKLVLHGVPKEVIFCKSCVMSNQRPNSVVEFKNTGKKRKPTIFFNENGICSACEYKIIKEKKIDWIKRKNDLKKLCDKFRSRNGSYDVVIPGSGGKDSIMVSHLLKYNYNMNPLTVTWAPHTYTNIGWINFQKWINSGFDNLLNTPNGKVHRLLTSISFKNLCHPFQPFIIGQRMTGPKFAALYNIPLVVYGEHPAEYGDRLDEAFEPKMKEKYFVLKNDLDSLVLGGLPAKKIIKDNNLKLSDLNPYLPVDPKLLKKTKVEVHHISYYINWDPQENYYYAVEKGGFKANTERTQGTYSKYSSIDDKLDPLHYFTTLIKFGIGRATYDAAQEIRNDKINREEGVSLVKKYDQEFPSKYYNEMLDYMNISDDEFWEVIDKNRSPHLWEKENGKWKLKHHVK